MSDRGLEVRDLGIAFGGVRAVDALNFDVPPASIISLIGPNGAGKTTVLNSISGFVRSSGSIRYEGREILPLPAYRRAGLGVGRTFQNLQLFDSMTLLDNVLTGQHVTRRGNVLWDVLRFPVLSEERRARDAALELLGRLGIAEYAAVRVDDLPFGVQKLAGVARALACRPALLLLDEPAAGLNRQETESFGERIRQLRDESGTAILLVEHNMRLVMGISDRIVVLDQGVKLTEGSPEEVRLAPAVIKAYLGEDVPPNVAREVHGELAPGP